MRHFDLLVVQSLALQVQVMAGKCKGEQGKITYVRRKQNLVFLEGINLASKHVATTPLAKGTVYSIEQGIHVSSIALIDPKLKVPTKIGWEMRVDESGFERKIRVSKLSGEEIKRPDIPERKRLDSEFGTRPDDVHKVTFVPDLKLDPIPKGCII